MVTSLELLHKYAGTFRRLINSKVWGSSEKIKGLLKLNKDEDWDFLTAAMDVVDDASAAIGNVQQFGLAGPTKYNNGGEKYLRLYGLLSAAYVQQQAVLTIYRIMNVGSWRDLRERFNSLKLRQVRHKLSSHSTEYENHDTGIIEAYVPLRISLGDDEITSVRYSSPLEHEIINLSEAIESHLRLLISVLDETIEKAIKTFFKESKDKQSEFSSELSDLRVEKDGGFVIRVGQDTKIVVSFIGPAPDERH
jgi:hypothetical protein